MHTLFDDALQKRGQDWISFEFGTPSDDLLPTDLIKDATMRLFKESSSKQAIDSLQYGPQLGSNLFKESIANWSLTHSFGIDTIAVTSGASSSLYCLANLFANQETIILVEDPTYFLGFRVLKQVLQENTFYSIPLKDSGSLNLDYLEDLLLKLPEMPTLEKDGINPGLQVETSEIASAKIKESKKFKFLLYFVPTFSNPTSKTMDKQDRLRLIQLAKKFDILIICDDVYHLLPFPSFDSLPETLVFLDQSYNSDGIACFQGNVISNQSFSKILGPGIRLGWIEGSPYLMKQIAKSSLLGSGGSPNQLTSNIVAMAIKDGSLTNHIHYLRSIYQERCTSLCHALEIHLPPQCTFTIPQGGFFVWIQIPNLRPPLKTSIILSTLLENMEVDMNTEKSSGNKYKIHLEKVSFTPGNLFALNGNDHENCLRLTFAMYSSERLVEGAARLGRVLKSCVI